MIMNIQQYMLGKDLIISGHASPIVILCTETGEVYSKFVYYVNEVV